MSCYCGFSNIISPKIEDIHIGPDEKVVSIDLRSCKNADSKIIATPMEFEDWRTLVEHGGMEFKGKRLSIGEENLCTISLRFPTSICGPKDHNHNSISY